MALKQKDDFKGAEVELRRAVAQDPKLPEAPYTLAVVLWQTGRPTEAIPFLRTAIALRPDGADAHYVLGTILRQQGELDEALAEFRETVRRRPDSADAHLSIGQILQQKRDTAGAAAAFAEADRLGRQKADAQASTLAVGVGKKRLEEGDRKGAIERFREAVRLDSGNAQAHYQLALTLRGEGAEAEARPHFAEAQRLAPYLRPPDAKD